MDNSIETRAASELLGMNFFIPKYQRGYRWGKQQVEDLLNDIYAFTKKKREPKEFYCLQPLVVKKLGGADLQKHKLDKLEGKWYEVIDGQQRLTTIKIILKYLIQDMNITLESEYKKSEFRLKYETREKSEDFFDRLYFDKSRIDDFHINDENIDFNYISHAFKTIMDWFPAQKKPRDVKISILDTFVHDKDEDYPTVQFIWYETDERDTEAIFRRLNIGKIPLTNAELIKALFLNSSNFHADGKDGSDFCKREGSSPDSVHKNRIYLRQLEIANRWDRIEYTLQDDEFWLFIHDDTYTNPTRIDFIFDLIQEKNYLGLDDKYLDALGTDSYKTFRYFN